MDDSVLQGERAHPLALRHTWSTCSKLYSAPLRCCSSVNAAPKSYLKSLPNAGNSQLRAAYACNALQWGSTR